jgi:hypothetical protein
MLKKLKDLFSGGSGDEGIYVYVKLNRSDEVVELRLTPQHELVPDYEQGGYISRKTIVGPNSYARAEATFRFDDNRTLVSAQIDGGELSTAEAYRAQFDE